MLEDNSMRMKIKSRKPLRPHAVSVERIAGNGIPQGRQMSPDLVSHPVKDMGFDETPFTEGFQSSNLGERGGTSG